MSDLDGAATDSECSAGSDGDADSADAEADTAATDSDIHPAVEHRSVDSGTRETVLDRDHHQCRFCGDRGTEAGGEATLQVHHIDRNPEGCAEHDPENLVTLCTKCHHWHHQRRTDELPVSLSAADDRELLGHDKQILAVLAEHGPSTTGEIVSHLDMEKTPVAVRERCWLLMGLDEIVAERDTQLVDQDAETGEWGLAEHIGSSERGRIPDDTRELLKRAEDERVRQLRERGFDRDLVSEIIGVTARTIRHKERRAKAYQFPLDVVAGSESRIDHRNRGGEDGCADTTDGTGGPEAVDAEDLKASEDMPSTPADTGADDTAGTAAETDTGAMASSDVWPSVGSLARIAAGSEASYLFVLNVDQSHNRLQAIQTSRLSEETRAQIAAAGEPSQLTRVADAVRLVTDGPHFSGAVGVFEDVPLDTVVSPDVLAADDAAE